MRHLYGIALAVSWGIMIATTIGVLAWHDPMVHAYWRARFERGSLFLSQRGEPATEPTASYPTWIAIMRYEADLSVGLAAASAGMILVNGVRSRRSKEAWRGPGAVACVVATAALVVCLLTELSRSRQAGEVLWGSPTNPFPNDWPHWELRISLAVLGAWLVMASIGEWRPQRAWADRVGIVIGTLWLGVMGYRMIGSLFIPLGNWGY